MPLNIEPNIASPDDFYEALLDAHRDLTHDERDVTHGGTPQGWFPWVPDPCPAVAL